LQCFLRNARVMRPAARTSAKSRARRSKRFAMRGVAAAATRDFFGAAFVHLDV